MKKYFDKKNNFIEFFNPETGFYLRSGILKEQDEKLVDTGVDPFMRNFPQLIDIGVMGHCIHGKKGLCIKSGVQCYQNGLHTQEPNMSLENYKKIVDECKGKTFSYALGGRGDVNKHENFKEILAYTKENGIIPNYTTSGLDLSDEEIAITKKYCGAVAISFYRSHYTYDAVKRFVEAGVKTNIHYVLGNNSIDEAIDKLLTDDFPDDINAVIFLLHKPIGLGSKENVLKVDDPRLSKFFKIIDSKKFSFKIGFDSCTIPGVLNFTENVDDITFDTCEAARYSCYITSDMKMIPCSFENQNLAHAVDLKENTVQEAWDSTAFEDFRDHFRNSCSGCSKKSLCLGGCPITREIVLCNKKEKDLK